MSRVHGDQRRRWPAWAARCLWGLVVAALLIHLIPGQGYRSATSVGWLIGAGWLLFTMGQTLGPARLPDLPAPNPAAVGGSAGRVLSVLQAGQVLAVAGGVLACISLIVRFRRSQSVVRKQIEWLAYAAAVVAAGLIVSVLVQLRPQTETLDNYTNGIVSLALASIPVAMGIAILTRRLYDIDVIVNKTVVYLSLAAFITAVYIALVVGIG